MGRPTFDETFFDIARVLSRRATCHRARVGAVVVGADNRILGSGYNGAPPGQPHCTEIGCKLTDGHCTRAVHAEMNALTQATPAMLQGSRLYVVGATPCYHCSQHIITVGVTEVLCAASDVYGPAGWALLEECGVKTSLTPGRKTPQDRLPGHPCPCTWCTGLRRGLGRVRGGGRFDRL